jgi:hypothetical protein
MIKTLFYITLIFNLSSCATAWIIEKTEYGGTIGYKNISTEDEVERNILPLIHCPKTYSKIFDKLVYDGTATHYIPIQKQAYSSGNIYGSNYTATYTGTHTYTENVPFTEQIYHREFGYKCEAGIDFENEAEINAETHQIPFDQRYSLENIQIESRIKCKEECKSLEVQKQLRSGENVESCIAKSCSK